jgi:hypothetical protein|tara:strand:- start:246 stop:503 length:258 start_codon:yes stop_codon:yes gene_type:complete
MPNDKDKLEEFKVEPITFTRVTLEVEKIRIDDILDQYRRKMQDRPLKTNENENMKIFEGYMQGLHFMEKVIMEATNEQSKTRQIH